MVVVLVVVCVDAETDEVVELSSASKIAKYTRQIVSPKYSIFHSSIESRRIRIYLVKT